MNKLKKMMSRIENMMSAATFAEAGEFETAREMIRRRKKVLLGITTLDAKALKYAVNICSRLDADLEVLLAGNEGVDKEILKRLKAELSTESISYTIAQKSGAMKKEIVDYTSDRSDILFVVVGSSSEINQELHKYGSNLSSSFNKIKCPLVVVADRRMPAAV